MTPLERRYRQVLRLLPADHRARWADDMVDTFLLTRESTAREPGNRVPDDREPNNAEPNDRVSDNPESDNAGSDALSDAEFDAEYGWPDWREVASVAGLAVRLRLGGAGAPARSVARGEVVRHVALAGLLVHAVASVVAVVSLVVAQARFPTYRVSDLATAEVLVGLLWTVCYLTLLADHRRAAGWLGVAALAPLTAMTVTDVVAGGLSVASAAGLVLSAALPVLALAAFHRDAPPVRARPWLVALPVGIVLVAAVAFATQTPGPVPLDWPGMLCVAVVVAGVGCLATGRAGPWTGALPVLAVAVLAERVLTLVDYARFTTAQDRPALLITLGVAQAAALLLVTAALTIRHRSAVAAGGW